MDVASLLAHIDVLPTLCEIVGVSIPEDVAGKIGTVDFQGSRLEVGLVFVPEAQEGDWVLVHAGFALQVLDEQEARETWQYLEEADSAEPR